MRLAQLRSFFGILAIVFSTVLIFSGCEKKDTGKEPTMETKKETPNQTETPKVEINTPDIRGKYTGTFDNKSATLNITGQKVNGFTGTLTVNYRKALNQDVAGEFDTKALTFTMKDVNPGKFQGTYKGDLSSDFTALKGTFTLNSKGGSYSFNLKKK